MRLSRQRLASKPAPAPFERLEARSLLSAPTASYVSATTNGTALFVVVDYHADQGLDLATLGIGDLVVSSNGRPDLTGTLFAPPSTLPNGNTRAIYIVPAQDGAWNYTHNGTYTVTSPAGQVKDLASQNLQSTGIGQFYLWFTTPRAHLTSTTVTATDWLIVVNYSDDTAIDTTTIDGADITVAGSGLYSGITRQSLIINSPSDVTAVYRVPAPAGGWNYTNSGPTTVSFVDSQVADSTGHQIPSFTLSSFNLWFDKPAAQVQPTTITPTGWLIPILFSGRANIDISSIAEGDIQVTAPNGYSADGHLQGVANNGNSTYTATYSVAARGGSWDWTDNSSYSVAIKATRVRDASARYVPAGTLGTYGLWFNNPAATMVLPTSVTLHQWDISVDFSDNRTLDLASITSSSIRVVSPGGNLTVSLLSTAAGPNGGTRANFRLTSVGGLANGHYEVWTNPNQTHDTQGTYVYEYSMASFWLWF